jgi:hypothetical protein
MRLFHVDTGNDMTMIQVGANDRSKGGFNEKILYIDRCPY